MLLELEAFKGALKSGRRVIIDTGVKKYRVTKIEGHDTIPGGSTTIKTKSTHTPKDYERTLCLISRWHLRDLGIKGVISSTAKALTGTKEEGDYQLTLITIYKKWGRDTFTIPDLCHNVGEVIDYILDRRDEILDQGSISDEQLLVPIDVHNTLSNEELKATKRIYIDEEVSGTHHSNVTVEIDKR